MAYDLAKISGNQAIAQTDLQQRIEQLVRIDGPRLRRLWAYYRNPMRSAAVNIGEGGADRPYRQAQEWGLPSRITGRRAGSEPFAGENVDGVLRKEVVIENDIGWRVDAMVIYLQIKETRSGRMFAICLHSMRFSQRCPRF